MGGVELVARKNEGLAEGSKAFAAVLADKAAFMSEKGFNTVAASVLDASYNGSHVKTLVMVNGVELSVVEYGGTSLRAKGDSVYVYFKPEDVVLLEAKW
jgi:ABC-type Fe3+/spermidine/putrescine transport system ATPase subunit